MRSPLTSAAKSAAQASEIDFGVATSPALGGESLVLRILDRQEVDLDFGRPGFDQG